MKHKKILSSSILSFALALTIHAQNKVDFSLNGLGRSYIIDNSLTGDIMTNDTKTLDKGIGGYNLFDLQNNLKLDSTFQAMVIYRIRGEFGGFFGSNSKFSFRQFKVMGKIGNFGYEIGDIRTQLTPFTIFNFCDGFHQYEAEIFKNRRAISEYENFNQGNSWLLQGAQAQYVLNKKNYHVDFYGFVTRTSPTNELNVADRILSGGRIGTIANKYKTGINFVRLNDLNIETSVYSYVNNVATADFEIASSAFKTRIEGGFSNFNNAHFTAGIADTTQKFNDYFGDLTLSYLTQKGFSIGLHANYVGPYFSSPTAQTRRVVDYTTPSLFNMVYNGSTARNSLLFDRLTSEQAYNAQISTTLTPFLQQFNNALPYGEATPNRSRIGLAIESDTAVKKMRYEVSANYLSEIYGEGTTNRRTFLVAAAGLSFDFSKAFNLKKKMEATVGTKFEKTMRANDATGGGAVALTSIMGDAGISYELIKKLDVLLGAKYLIANGNEFIATRNVYNVITNFNGVSINSSELISSAGIQLRVNTNQYFTVQYNNIIFNNQIGVNSSYNISQLFLSYTGKF